jgi:methanogenic corrinoid protein MtbC1
MMRIGTQWQRGELRVAQEHLASAQLRYFLGHLLEDSGAYSDGPRLLAAAPSGQLHEMGSLMAGIVANLGGWLTVYLGANAPTDEIAFTVSRLNVRAIALSIVYPADDVRLAGELRRLRAQVRNEVTIFIGGRAADGYLDVIAEIGATRVTSLQEFNEKLGALRRSAK